MEFEYYEDTGLFCNACHYQLDSIDGRSEHYRSDWHRYNVKRRCADLPPIPKDLFERKFNEVKRLKEAADAAANEKIICDITKREFKSHQALNHFKNSKEYKRQLAKFEKMKADGLIDEDGNKIIPADKKVFNKHIIDYKAPAEEDDVINENDEFILKRDNDVEEVEEDNDLDEEMDDGENVLEEGQKAIPLKYSLFDNVGPFKTVRGSLNYMLKNFGFFLPFVDFLIDVEGLLEFLGAKIGIGHQCLLCNKRFGTTMGVQQHMTSQAHCMFTLQDVAAEEEDEYLAFYDFSHNLIEMDDDEVDEDGVPLMTPEDKLLLKQQQRLRTLQLLGIRKATEDDHMEEEDRYKGVLTVPKERSRHIVDMNAGGEIIFSDGSFIGSRKLKQTYKVATASAHEENSAVNLRRQLISQYYALSMPGYDVKSKEQKDLEKSNKQHQKYIEKHKRSTGQNMNMILRKHFVPQVPM